MSDPSPRGRPRASSRRMLEDAAFELFLEQSYARTTIEQIALRAGVSRNTFFNYFESKSDVFWVDVDEALARLEPALRSTPVGASVTSSVREALVDVGGAFGPATVPWVLTQSSLIGGVNELQASALARLSAQADVIAAFAAARARRPLPNLVSRSFAYGVIGASVASAQAWADAGTSRGDLVPYLHDALEPVLAGFSRVVDD